ncbi:MAG: hypothetical protein KDA84_05000 [Planctomycetaceae bacterium]|nr:hypothetical protein [Planctomycetaceae bacterium]
MIRFIAIVVVSLITIGGTKTTHAQVLPIHDDASLHDLQFVGSQVGWAVGDHGVVWRTTNGGKHWDLVPCPVDCPLRSVCFLTDRVGWVAGGGVTPHTRLSYGVVLFTDNAGQSWRMVARDTIPPIQSIKFFSLKQGVAVAEASQDHPTGVLTTEDGGKNWQPVLGEKHSGWRAAHFLQSDVGVVAGLKGQVKLVGGGRLLASQSGTQGLKNIRAITLSRDYRGWLAGDGGLIRQTDNGGVSWQSPSGKIPDEAKNLIDFRAVATQGSHVWLAGKPGSVIWHSPDNGQTWQKQFTGETVPISAMHFTSESIGYAVGAMGMILATGDGGQTWQALRGSKRRVAILTLSARPSQIPFALLTKLSGDEGYRSTVYMPARRDFGADADDFAGFDLKLSEAITVAGGSFAESNWQLPVAVPGLEKNQERLLADWNSRTENKFQSTFLENLVRRIRTWKPDLIILDEPAEDDALNKLIHDAVKVAVNQAADPTLYIAHQEHAGLGTWEVRKIYQRLPQGSVGDAHIDLHEYLPRRKTALHTAASPARNRLFATDDNSTEREAYRVIFDRTRSADGSAGRSDFFTGLSIPPNSAARRALLPVDPQQDAQRRAVITRQRNFHAYVERMINDPRHATQLIGQLRQITDGMTQHESALELARLAENYRHQSRWDLVESTLVELVELYPNEPVAHDAMRWLFQLWNAAEPAWQRSRLATITRSGIRTDTHGIQERINKALEQASNPQIELVEYQRPQTGPDPVQFITQAGSLKINKETNWRTGTVANWQEQAVQMATLIRHRSPVLFLEPEIQFPLATLMRQRGVYRLSDSYYRRYQRLGDDDAWKTSAATELWLTNPIAVPPKPILQCLPTNKRPKLDGVLSDTCWQAAKIVELKTAEVEDINSKVATDTSFLMFCYDQEFLYIAGSLPRVEHVSKDGVQLGGRKHDADLSLHDHVTIALDVDRDYATWYTLKVDQRGWTSDKCWDDRGWNPKWYVAAEADEKRWSIEAAIPFEELVPQTPKAGATWAIGIVRTMPAVGVQGWPASSDSKTHPESFGLIRFQ